jgi:type I restriction enzyme, S subunit
LALVECATEILQMGGRAMITDLRPYTAMKDSGVPWLGTVPEHWEVRRLGQIGRLSKGKGGNKDDEESSGVPCVRYGDLYTTHTFFIPRSRSFVSPETARAYTPISFGDVLFAASGETIDDIGKSAVNLIKSEACCGGDVILFRPKYEVEARYIGYATDCRPIAAQKATMGRGITVKHIYGDQLKYLTLALPPLPEQAAIARFLDHADRRIRRYILAKQKLIKLLKEQKQAIIHRAVTRGLNPNGRLKPLGSAPGCEVNSRWRVARLWEISRIRSEKKRADLGLLSVFLGRGVIPYGEGGGQVHKPSLDLAGYQVVYPGDLVLNNQQAWRGSVGVSKYRGIISPAYVVIGLADALDSCFADYLFQSGVMVSQFVSSSKGVGDIQRDIHTPWLKNARVPIPPLVEQQAIAASLDQGLGDIARQLSLLERETSLLREYRTRLVADVVTGKLDVRAAAANLSDESGEPEVPDDTDALAEGDEPADGDLNATPEESEA